MELSARVRDVLASARADGPRLVLVGPRLDRTTYAHVSRVLEDLGGTWSRRDQAHVFKGDAKVAIAAALAAGSVADAKADHGAFYTPPELAIEIVARAEIAHGLQLLEPSAGDGALAAPAAAAGADVTCMEIREDACAILRGQGLQVEHGDFLEARPSGLGLFDRVVMNPPFGRRMDVVHVRHAMRFLRPGGRLIAIVSAGVLNRTDRATRDLRELVDAQGGAIERLPPASFRMAGTEVHAALVAVDLRRLRVAEPSSAAERAHP